MITSWNSIKSHKKKYWAVSPLILLKPNTSPLEVVTSLEFMTSDNKKIRIDPIIFCENNFDRLEKDIINRIKTTFKVAREIFKQQQQKV